MPALNESLAITAMGHWSDEYELDSWPVSFEMSTEVADRVV